MPNIRQLNRNSINGLKPVAYLQLADGTIIDKAIYKLLTFVKAPIKIGYCSGSGFRLFPIYLYNNSFNPTNSKQFFPGKEGIWECQKEILKTEEGTKDFFPEISEDHIAVPWQVTFDDGKTIENNFTIDYVTEL